VQRGNVLRSTAYRGVTRHKRSGRFEAHQFVKELGKQVYIGGWAKAEDAAAAYDIVLLKARGQGALTNFPAADYAALSPLLERHSVSEVVQAVRRQSQGHSRGAARHRGVTVHNNGAPTPASTHFIVLRRSRGSV